MLWRLLTGRVTKSSLLVFLIVVGIRGCYVYNKQQAARDLPPFPVSLWATPEPTEAILGLLVEGVPASVATPPGAMTREVYEQRIMILLPQYFEEIDLLSSVIQASAQKSFSSSEQYNNELARVAERFNAISAIAIELKHMHAPPLHDGFHRNLILLLDSVERVNLNAIATIDLPSSNVITDEELQQMSDSVTNAVERLAQYELARRALAQYAEQ